jgi:hypothetical protein
VCDFDGDGRVDVVISQNGAETKLYRNKGAQPGLRVRLRGPAGNPDGIGAVCRAATRTGVLGAAHEIHAGSGYWSQDSAVQVLASPEPLTKLEVRWPDGRVTISTAPAGVRELTLDALGKIVLSK